MSSLALYPNPCLVAIILTTKTRTGVHHVFHYPANPGQDKSYVRSDDGDSSDDSSTGWSTDAADLSSVEYDEDDEKTNNGRGTGNEPGVDESLSASPDKNTSGWRGPESHDRFLGLPFGLQHFLCPAETANKKRFEMTIDGLVFLGWPVFSKDNGVWRKKKRKKSKDLQSSTNETQIKVARGTEDPGDPSRKDSMHDGQNTGETTEEETGEETGMEDKDQAVWDPTHETTVSTDDKPQDNAYSSKELLNMFHVVFVMNPPPLEYQLRVDQMYHNVVKKFSKALRWAQTRSNFVLEETEKIRELKSKNEPFHNIMKYSPLAKSLATLYTSISTSRIAHITLTPTLTFSLQIPIPTSTPLLPTATEPQVPGLWLTTATSVPTADDEVHNNTPSQLASHFALLLLSDLSSTLNDIASTASPLLSGPLTHYLHVSTPTKSFLQISQASGIPLSDIQFLASHLIYWRRARAVPPLHHKDTYIVSPNAAMQKLKSASVQYARLFPALPTLPKMLSLLSAGGPRPYNNFIPSTDHKSAYLEILAWLLRGGWVTQLRTFAWVRVPSRIREIVAREMDQEEANETKETNSDSPSVRAASASKDGDAGLPDLPPDTLLPPHPAAASNAKSTLSSLASSPSSVSSAQTAIPFSPSPVPPNNQPAPAPLPHLILHPTKASGVEARYLTAIATDMENAIPDATAPHQALAPDERRDHHARGTMDKRNNPGVEIARRGNRTGGGGGAGGNADGDGDGNGDGKGTAKSVLERKDSGKYSSYAVGMMEGHEVREAWEKCLKYFNGEHAVEKIAVREGWKRKKVDALRADWSARGILVEVRHW